MTYSTLMVHMDLEGSDAAVLHVAADLAERFKADVIGIAACHPMQIVYTDGYIVGDLIEEDLARKQGLLAQAEARFRDALAPRAPNLHWRSAICYMPLSEYIAENARAADLVILSPPAQKSVLKSWPRLDVGELVIQLGRPALIVPSGTERLRLEHVMIAWKDTRETRRAIVDALPLLRVAARVTVAQVAPEEELPAARSQLADVAAWLGRQGVAAHPVAAPLAGDDTAGLHAIALEHEASVLIAGAYGHNRLREWALGGVTRDLLTRPTRCALLSH